MDKKSNMPGIFLKLEWAEEFERLTHEEAGVLLKNTFREVEKKELIPMNQILNLFFNVAIKPTQTHNHERYLKRIEENTKNGKKGGAPMGNQNARKQSINENNPNQAKQPKDIDIDTERVIDIEKDKANNKDIINENMIVENEKIISTISNQYSGNNINNKIANNFQSKKSDDEYLNKIGGVSMWEFEKNKNKK